MQSAIGVREGARALEHELLGEIRGLMPLPEALEGNPRSDGKLYDPQRRCWTGGQRPQQTDTLRQPTVRALEHRSLSPLEEHASDNVRRVVREHPVVRVSI